ncbi:MAG: hypothetical protein AAGB22_10805, partial [Bacteroidota bacterium]
GIAHKAKSGFKSLGLHDTVNRLVQVEKLALAENGVDEITTLYDSIRSDFEAVVLEIDGMLSNA